MWRVTINLIALNAGAPIANTEAGGVMDTKDKNFDGTFELRGYMVKCPNRSERFHITAEVG